MDVVDAIKTRRSIRKYLEVPIPWEQVVELIEAGRMAPSAGNLQNWKFILYTSPEKRQAIAEACLQQYWIADAPLIMVIVAETEKAKKYYGDRGAMMYSIQSAAAVTQNVLLRAHELGLGACWVSAFEDEMMTRITGTPDSASVQAVIPIGYPDEEPEATPRYDLVWFTRFDSFGNRFTDLVDMHHEYSEWVMKAVAKGKAMLKKWKEKIQTVK